MKRGLHLLWRLPLRYALWLALPLQILAASVVFDGWAAWARMAAYAKDAMPPLDQDQLLYFTRTELERSWSRLVAAPFPEHDQLETVQLTISREAIGELDLDLPHSGQVDSKNATLVVGSERRQVKARYMGDNHWHWMYPQKSWRIKTASGDPLRNRSSFNLKNPPTRLLIDETVACEIASEIGLLAPEVRPVKLLVNGVYAGLYLWWDVADESLLRRARRMPGSIYSGDSAPVDASTGVSRLWRDQQHWQKAASHSAEQELDRSDIAMLVAAVNDGDPLAFSAFAERSLDLEQIAKFVALDRAFAGAHHDFHHNHKLYFDPYKSRFEPIEWDLNEWHLTRPATGFDAALNPLLIALRRHPHYEHRLQQELWRLLATALHPDAVAEKLQRWAEAIEPALAADGDRDARDWQRPMRLRLPFTHCTTFGMKKYRRWVEQAITEYRRRHDGLRAVFEDALVDQAFAVGPERRTAVLDLGSGGHVSQVVRRLRVAGRASRAALFRDSNLDGELGAGDALVAEAAFEGGVATFALDEHVLPGLCEVPRRSGDPVLFGLRDLVPCRLSYRYFVTADGALDGDVELSADNAVTGTALEVARRTEPAPAVDAFSCRPWRLPARPAERTVTLGPGEIVIGATREFGQETRVEIAAGTRFRLAPGASLLFRGPVHAAGSEVAPIEFAPLRPGEPWGVVSLRGRRTAGSSFVSCHFADGSVADDGLLHYSGMVSILDTKDIRFVDCRIGRNHIGDDAMHWGYIDGGLIHGCSFTGALGDALDLDVCRRVRIEDCAFESSGNDLVDLMTCAVAVTDCVFRLGGDKGISVGESSTLDLDQSELARCAIGVEIKDDSTVRTGAGVVMRDCGIGVNLYRKDLHYDRGGTLEGTAPVYRGSGVPQQRDSRSHVRPGGAAAADAGAAR